MSNVMKVVLDNLELLAKGEFKELCALGDCKSTEIKKIAIQIRSYNPKPGSSFIREPVENQREPDLIVTRDGKEIEISLNRASLPGVKVNLEYLSLIHI